MQTPQRLADTGWLPLLGGGLLLAGRAIIRALLPPGWHFRAIERWMTPDQDDDEDGKDSGDDQHRP